MALRTRIKAGLGWRRSPPDFRDLRYSVALSTLKSLPPSVDLRAECPPILDQEAIGSCTANALSGAVQFDRMKNGLTPVFVPSRLFIYYNERSIEGDVPLDAGAFLRDGIKSLSSVGVCPEPEWPYVPTPPLVDSGPFPIGSPPATQPPQQCYDDAANYRIATYQSVDQSLNQLKGVLAEGFPFVFGFSVYDSLWDEEGIPRTVFPFPSGNDSRRGGHAVMIVGYDDSTALFAIHNSWGADVGEDGYFYIPYAYVTDSGLAADFWVIETTAN
jgi:C1A family cysteine protease